MAGAGIAFQTPLIGRKLPGLFSQAGFEDVRVAVLASADTTGALRAVLANMASYAQTAGAVSATDTSEFLQEIDAAIDAGTYVGVLPQFLVTGSR